MLKPTSMTAEEISQFLIGHLKTRWYLSVTQNHKHEMTISFWWLGLYICSTLILFSSEWPDPSSICQVGQARDFCSETPHSKTRDLALETPFSVEYWKWQLVAALSVQNIARWYSTSPDHNLQSKTDTPTIFPRSKLLLLSTWKRHVPTNVSN